MWKSSEEFIKALRKEPITQPPPIRPVDRNAPLPLSFFQERIWFIHQLQPKSPAYNITLPIHLTGQLNVAALEQSFN